MTGWRRMAHALTSIPVGVGLMLGGLVCLAVWSAHLIADHRAERSALLTIAASQQVDRVEMALAAVTGSAMTFGASVTGDREVDLERFRRETQILKTRYPSMVGFGWVPFVAAPERAAFERQGEETLGTPFQILDRGLSGRFVPAAARDRYWPLLYADLSMVNGLGTGLDLAGLKERFDQIWDEMAQRPRPIMTQRLRLANASPDAFCVFLLVPVFQAGSGEATAPLKGVMLSLIDIHALVQASLGTLREDGRFSTLIQDQTAVPGKQILYHETRPYRQAGPVLAEKSAIYGGRSWRIAVLTSPDGGSGGGPDPVALFAGGILVGGFVLLTVAGWRRPIAPSGRDGIAAEGVKGRSSDADEVPFQADGALFCDWFWQSDVSHAITTIYPTAPHGSFDPRVMLGRRLSDDAEVSHCPDARRQVLDRQEPLVDYRVRCRTAAGDRVFSCRASPVRDGAGVFIGYRGVARDITDIAEACAPDTRQPTDASPPWAKALIAGTSERIRQSLDQLAHAIERSPPDETAPATARSARHIIGKIDQLLENLYDYHLLASGDLSLATAPFHFEAVMADLLSMVARDAEAKGITLKAQIPPQTLPWLSGDEKRVRQIVFTLLSNAIDHSAGGTITVTVATADRADGRIDVGLSVRDEGSGFSRAADEQIKAWLKKPATDPIIIAGDRGIGLGLFLCRALCGLMGGELGLDNHPGQGATVRAHLVCAPAAPPIAVLRSRLAQPVLEMDQVSILLAEDNAINQMMTQDLLQSAGYRVVMARNGRDVLEVLSHDRIDLILMDSQMPVMDGVTAARYIRALSGAIARVPIIAMTADLALKDAAIGTRAGIDDCLIKPVTRDALLALVARYAPAPTPAQPFDAAAS